MPTPLPDYVPGPVVDYIKKKKLNGLKGLAKQLGRPHTSICQSFRESEHEAFGAFINFCEKVQMDPDELGQALSLPQATRTEILKRSIYKEYESLEKFYTQEGICDKYVRGLFSGECGRKIVNLYMPLARLIGLTLGHLYSVLTVPRNDSNRSR